MIKLRAPAIASLALGLPLLYMGIGTENDVLSRQLGGKGGGGGGGGPKDSGGGDTENSMNCALDTSKYDICLVTNGFQRKVASTVQSYFEAARLRWMSVIVGHLPGECSTGGISDFDLCSSFPAKIDDLYVCARGQYIDGPGGVLGSAGVSVWRTDLMLPVVGNMNLDNDDVQTYLGPQLQEIILHEFGHILGLNKKFWEMKGLTANGLYHGTEAVREWAETFGCNYNPPIERDFGNGTAYSHWDEAALGNELMTGIFNPNAGQPLSRITVGALADLGYTVDYSQADDITIDCPVPFTAGRRRLSEEREPRLLQAAGGGDPEGGAARRRLSAQGKAHAKAYGKQLLAERKKRNDEAVLAKGGSDPSVAFAGDAFVDVIYAEEDQVYAVEVTEEDLEEEP